MFHVNETKNGRGTLASVNGKMVLHVSLAGKNIVNLYPGTAENAKSDESHWLSAVEDTVTYEDGTSEKVCGFNIPVSKLEKDFDLALVGKKGIWYDHKVSVSDIQEIENPADGNYDASVVLQGGTGKASIQSPAKLIVKNGKGIVTLKWSSKNYDYMIVNGKKFLNETPDEKSTFTIPVNDLTKPFSVIADTTAMGTPHEIEYTIGLLF